MNVISLLGRNGAFETSPLYSKGTRSFGLFNYNQPKDGDLIIFYSQRVNSKVLYRVTGMLPLVSKAQMAIVGGQVR